MTWEILAVFGVTLGALVLFVSERYRIDQVSIAVPAALLALGLLSPEQAVSGFSHPATITVTALLALSIGLSKTGVVETIGRWARRLHVGGPRRRLLALCLFVAALSPFVNNTAVVVILLPVFLGLAREDEAAPSLYLMPLSFVAMLGGTVSLIGTSTNLIVWGMARDRGLDGLSLFSIAPLGLVYLAVGLVYVFTIGRWLMPRREGRTDLSGKYQVARYQTELEVSPGSDGVGRSLAELGWDEAYGITILGFVRDGETRWRPGPDEGVEAGDVLLAQGSSEDLLALARGEGLSAPTRREEREIDLDSEEARLAEVLVGPTAPIVERTIEETDFEERFGVTLLAVLHHEETTRTRLAEVHVLAGDLLLVHGRPNAIEALASTGGLIPLREVEPPVVDRPRAAVAVLILTGVVGLAALDVAPIVATALVGVVAMVFTGCLTIEELYEEMDWMVVFLLAGVIPLGIAMDRSGAAQWIADGVTTAVAGLGPRGAIAGFYAVAAILTAIVSNNATAIVLTPIAILTARDLGMNPYSLLVAVMFGASASFVTPMGYQTNTMIYGPGGYRFRDFLVVGGPLNLLLLVTATILIPLFWPS